MVSSPRRERGGGAWSCACFSSVCAPCSVDFLRKRRKEKREKEKKKGKEKKVDFFQIWKLPGRKINDNL
jgi:hypothetical protein